MLQEIIHALFLLAVNGGVNQSAVCWDIARRTLSRKDSGYCLVRKYHVIFSFHPFVASWRPAAASALLVSHLPSAK